MSSIRKRNSISAKPTSAEIRQAFLDFFAERGHTIVPSASLVPGGDKTLLFTNAGMVQFKDMFLGTGTRSYRRAVDSQKCMRVAGKHNDLEDVGRNNTHHTFFEMLGNWSFGDYYKKEAIEWAWELLTEAWGLPRESLWATCFEDEKGEIPRDVEAAEIWRQQPGFNSDQLLFFGRKENFWEMGETGPSGPCSEIHLDRGLIFCDMQDVDGHVCQVNGDCPRFLELWNLVFIQYNRLGPTDLQPLPEQHIDTGMGFERIVSVLQNVDSNYKTDIFTPIMDRIQQMAGHTDAEREEHLTPYRVVADHGRTATFLIADGVVPGNTGRNYVCRMIIRRASRFGSMAGLEEPFLAQIAEATIDSYGSAYPELAKNRETILATLTEEERRFQRTVEAGVAHLTQTLEALSQSKEGFLPGQEAFDLYATYGLPLEITRDIALENGMRVDEEGFLQAMETHRQASGTDQAFGSEDGQDLETYRQLLADLQEKGQLPPEGVHSDPYGPLERGTQLLALVKDGQAVESASAGDEVSAVLSTSPFYIEAGGQITDTGTIVSPGEPGWRIEVRSVRKPISGIVSHQGVVGSGQVHVGDEATAAVDRERRWDIMRNHTATHLLHYSLRAVLGEHARQAGSLVAPDRLRFDFTHPQAMSPEQIADVEALVNQAILANHRLEIQIQPREEAIDDGALALFGETYGETVRSIRIGSENPISNELCGGTHVPETGLIGPFIILSEGSVAAGIRRIEAITGREALAHIRLRLAALQAAASRLSVSPENLDQRVDELLEERRQLIQRGDQLRQHLALVHYDELQPEKIDGTTALIGRIPEAKADVLRLLVDRFRDEYPSGVIVLASVLDDRPVIVAGASSDLVSKGLHAGKIVDAVAKLVGGGGGGKPTLAQAGGKDASRLTEALQQVPQLIQSQLAADS